MIKLMLSTVVSIAFVGAAVAADMPRPQPAPVAGPVGKAPIGKYPVGKSPVGKYPVGKYPQPLVTKG
jgi:hypothetical protein